VRRGAPRVAGRARGRSWRGGGGRRRGTGCRRQRLHGGEEGRSHDHMIGFPKNILRNLFIYLKNQGFPKNILRNLFIYFLKISIHVDVMVRNIETKICLKLKFV
jgi:hypothetical protein